MPDDEQMAPTPIPGAQMQPEVGGSRNPHDLTFGEARAKWRKVEEALRQLKALRKELDELVLLGDLVEPEDVVKGAASLISEGFSAHEMAALLSTMPPGGEALQQWILVHDQQVQEWEENAEKIVAQSGHELAVAGLHVLMDDFLGGAPPTMTASTPTAGSA